MDITSEQVWTLVGAITAIALGWVGAAWKGSGKVQSLQKLVDGAQAIVDRVQEELVKADELLASMKQQLGKADEQVANAKQQLAIAQQELAQAERIKQAHIATNADFEKSRDEAWSLYRLQSLQAGNAQAMLFREIERAVVPLNTLLKEKGLPPFQINPQIQNVMNDFKEQHVQRSQG